MLARRKGKSKKQGKGAKDRKQGERERGVHAGGMLQGERVQERGSLQGTRIARSSMRSGSPAGQKAEREEIQGWASLPLSMSASASQGGGDGESAGAVGRSFSRRPCIAEVYSMVNMSR